MIIVCTFVLMYPWHGTMQTYVQPYVSCGECGELVAAYLEAGPPNWLEGSTVVPMCVRRNEEARPA